MDCACPISVAHIIIITIKFALKSRTTPRSRILTHIHAHAVIYPCVHGTVSYVHSFKTFKYVLKTYVFIIVTCSDLISSDIMNNDKPVWFNDKSNRKVITPDNLILRSTHPPRACVFNKIEMSGNYCTNSCLIRNLWTTGTGEGKSWKRLY